MEKLLKISIRHPTVGSSERTFSKASIMIGRAPGNDILLEEGEISRFHAVILYEEGTLFVQDAGSKNGVILNPSMSKCLNRAKIFFRSAPKSSYRLRRVTFRN